MDRLRRTVRGGETSYLGYLRYALEYFAAATAAHAAIGGGREHAGLAAAPIQQLSGQSIELCFKSFLLQYGANPDSLSGIGHRLMRAQSAAAELGLSHNAELKHLATLDKEYGGRPFRFRYLKTGAITALAAADLFTLNAKIAQATLRQTPQSWRFLTQAAGRSLTRDGWLDLLDARGREDRGTKLEVARSKAIERVMQQTSSRQTTRAYPMSNPND